MRYLRPLCNAVDRPKDAVDFCDPSYWFTNAPFTPVMVMCAASLRMILAKMN